MNGNQIEALIGMLAVVALFAIMVLPALFGMAHDRRVDREIREAQDHLREKEDQKSSSRSTVPSTATWYAEGRRSKKLVSS
ncbi:hypothetical protein I2W78_12315 [Streptomyces spinoverrucosus]|uniref:hypothetical protein n=1 Tax=Streptomyces spinoverrucosus TaxID=284043 RepID=UPI0018C43F0D|nr:hypothetical protein [Streptomyces spinoverrucosus]MBG0852602.1 hypothetical protein [Streptomyces spinoverrucosus]